MKKILLLPLLLCLFLVTACEDDDQPAGPAANAMIKGTWITLEMKYELFDPSGTKIAEKKDIQYDRFIFEDGSVTALDPYGNPTNAAYSVTEKSGSNPSLAMTVGTLPRIYNILAIENTSMLLSSDNSGDTQNLSTALSEKDERLATTRLTIQLNKLQ